MDEKSIVPDEELKQMLIRDNGCFVLLTSHAEYDYRRKQLIYIDITFDKVMHKPDIGFPCIVRIHRKTPRSAWIMNFYTPEQAGKVAKELTTKHRKQLT